jgi:hypothetical protein
MRHIVITQTTLSICKYLHSIPTWFTCLSCILKPHVSLFIWPMHGPNREHRLMLLRMYLLRWSSHLVAMETCWQSHCLASDILSGFTILTLSGHPVRAPDPKAVSTISPFRIVSTIHTAIWQLRQTNVARVWFRSTCGCFKTRTPVCLYDLCTVVAVRQHRHREASSSILRNFTRDSFPACFPCFETRSSGKNLSPTFLWHDADRQTEI